TSNKPVWYIGDANTNDGGDLAHATYGNNKNGSVSGQVNSGTPGGAKPFPTTFSVNFGPPVVAPSIRNGNIKISATGDTVYAAIPDPSSHALLELWQGTFIPATASVPFRMTWTKLTAPSNYMGSQGNYTSAILATCATVYVAGLDHVFMSTDSG